MLPAPTTIATSTPWSRVAVTWRATAVTRSGSVPYWRSPISASPDSFRRMRLKAGAIAAQSLYRPLALLAYGKAREPADHHVLAGGRGQLVAQLLDRLAVELGVVHDLLEQHHSLEPRVELALDDAPADVLRLVGGLLLIHACLRLPALLRHIVPAHVPDARRRGDLHGDLACKTHELIGLGNEVRVAVHLDEHTHLRAGVHISLDGALRGRSLAEILDLLALPHAKDLDRLLHVALGLGERALAVHHARPGAIAQGLHVLCRDVHRVHDAPASALLCSLCSLSCWPPSASAAGGSAPGSTAGGSGTGSAAAGSGTGSGAGGSGSGAGGSGAGGSGAGAAATGCRCAASGAAARSGCADAPAPVA